MKRQWKERFECELDKINEAITKKGNTKGYAKVVEREGRVIERYLSARHDQITYLRNQEKPE